MDSPLVSIIVPTHNRAALLQDCILSILNSNYQNLEIIVIDDNSSDETSEVLKSFGDKIVKITNKESQFLIRSRNIGAHQSHGKYLLFIDDDNVIDKDMVSNLVNTFAIRKNVGIVGPLMLYFSAKDKIWWSETIISKTTALTKFPLRNHYFAELREHIKSTDGIPNVFLVKREVFENLNGFDESYIDTWTEGDFCEKAKINDYEILRNANAITYHRVFTNDWGSITERSVGDSPIKAYTTIRNRYLFVGKYFTIFNKISFGLFFSWIILFGYIFYAIKFKNFKNILIYLKATKDGLPFLFK